MSPLGGPVQPSMEPDRVRRWGGGTSQEKWQLPLSQGQAGTEPQSQGLGAGLPPREMELRFLDRKAALSLELLFLFSVSFLQGIPAKEGKGSWGEGKDNQVSKFGGAAKHSWNVARGKF
ncbi:hypothetical protein Chor_007415 [Crotalus horridus]